MEFHEAAKVARQHPGAVLTRDSSGTFIVRLDGGRVIGGTTEPAVDSRQIARTLRIERDEILRMLQETRADFELREKKLQAEITKLHAQLSKVSEAEWARIAQEGQRMRERERAEYLARDEAAKRIAKSMVGPSISSNNIVVFSSTDGQD